MKQFTMVLLSLVVIGTMMLTGCGKVRDNTVAKNIVKNDIRDFQAKKERN
jgi:hypothetical protein